MRLNLPLQIHGYRLKIVIAGIALMVLVVIGVSIGLRSWLGSRSRINKAANSTARATVDEANNVLIAPDDLKSRKGVLSKYTQRALNVLGDRFETAGKERLILDAELTEFQDGQRTQKSLRITREWPDHLRIEERGSGEPQTYGFDGHRLWAGDGDKSPSEEEARILVFLARDSIEHFIAGQASKYPTDPLNSHYRLDTADGPAYYDLLNVADRFAGAKGGETRPTFYLLNSATGLPERISYNSGGAQSAGVEVIFSNWQTVDGQKIPTRTIRKESGNVVFEMEIRHASVSAAQSDNSFNGSNAR